MISELEEAAVEQIKEKLTAAVSRVDAERGIPAIGLPDVQVSIEEGRFIKETSDTYKLEATGYVDITFKELSSDQQRRKGVYLILEGIVQALLLQTLNLKIKPIVPKDFKNVTSREDHGEGKIVYTLSFVTSWYVTKLDDEAAADLLTVGLGYYINEASDTPAVTDTVTLQGEL